MQGKKLLVMRQYTIFVGQPPPSSATSPIRMSLATCFSANCVIFNCQKAIHQSDLFRQQRKSRDNLLDRHDDQAQATFENGQSRMIFKDTRLYKLAFDMADDIITHHQKMNDFLIPKRHILNRAQLQELQCSICYQVEPQIVRCSGPCKKIFCYHCATRSKVNSSLCPNRCSNSFQVEPIPNLKILFKCPFDGELCSQPIEGVQAFWQHVNSCKYIFKEFEQQMDRNKKFLCPKGHKLLFLNQQTFYQLYTGKQFYKTTINEICRLCERQTLCLSICKECSTNEKKCVFCIKCRSLPCTKTMCPIGHQYVKRQIVCNTTICDFCGIAASIFANMTYRDAICNFDICEICHQKLPETHPLVPFVQSKEKKQGKLSLIARLLNFRSALRN